VSVTEPNDAVNAGMAKETEKLRLALHPQLAIWLVACFVALLVGWWLCCGGY